jgi:hypothetical protein
MNKSVYTWASSIRLDTGWVVTDGYLCAATRTSSQCRTGAALRTRIVRVIITIYHHLRPNCSLR